MNYQTIASAITDMRQSIVANTHMLVQGIEVEFVADLAIRVMSIDPVTFEYAVTDGEETFRCYNEKLFVKVLINALIQ